MRHGRGLSLPSRFFCHATRPPTSPSANSTRQRQGMLNLGQHPGTPSDRPAQNWLEARHRHGWKLLVAKSVWREHEMCGECSSVAVVSALTVCRSKQGAPERQCVGGAGNLVRCASAAAPDSRSGLRTCGWESSRDTGRRGSSHRHGDLGERAPTWEMGEHAGMLHRRQRRRIFFRHVAVWMTRNREEMSFCKKSPHICGYSLPVY